MSKYAFGIDLGTTNSALSMNAGGVSETVYIYGRNTIPSVVWYRADGSVVVGAEAYVRKHRKDVVYSSKRDMGTNTVYHLTLEDGSSKDVTPIDVASEVLKAIVKGADPMYGKVDEAVITVPAYFNDSQRIATRQAAEKAGIKVLGMINEPTAAALAYGVNHDTNKMSNVLVVDVGGGTTDITLMTITNYNDENEIPEPLREVVNTGITFNVVATGGNNRLGGDDYDENIIMATQTRLIRENKSKRKELKDIKDGTRKQKLSDNSAMEKFYRDNLTAVRYKPDVEMWKKLDNESLCITDNATKNSFLFTPADKMEGFKRFWVEIDKCIEDTMNYTTINSDGEKVIIGRYDNPQICIPVGGSTKNPWLLNMLKEKFKSTGMEIPSSTFADEAIALGAAVKAAMIKGIVSNITLKEINPLPIGVETVGERNGKNVGGLFHPVIQKDVTIPVRESLYYTTSVDNQTELIVNIYQGTSTLIKNNQYLGTLTVKDLPPLPAEEVIVTLYLEVDVDGMLTVTAMYDGKKQSATFNNILNSATREYTKAEERTMKYLLNVKDYMESIGGTSSSDYEEVCNWIPGNKIPQYAVDNRKEISKFLRNSLNTSLTSHFKDAVEHSNDNNDDSDDDGTDE